MIHIYIFTALLIASMTLSSCGPSESHKTQVKETGSSTVTDNQGVDDAIDNAVAVEQINENEAEIALINSANLNVATADLVVPEGFTFKQTYPLTVTIKNETLSSGFLSMCSDFTYLNGKFEPNYDNCLLRTTIKEGFSTTLELPNNVTSVLAVIWYLEENKQPVYQVWEKGVGVGFVVDL